MDTVKGKCRNLLYNTIFLVLFCAGCLIGVILFRYASDANPGWVCAYGSKLFSQMPDCLMGVTISACRPFLVLLALSMIPWGHRLVPGLILVRGILSSYFACICYVSGVSPVRCLLHGILILPGYYFLCRWICFGRPMRYASFAENVP